MEDEYDSEKSKEMVEETPQPSEDTDGNELFKGLVFHLCVAGVRRETVRAMIEHHGGQVGTALALKKSTNRPATTHILVSQNEMFISEDDASSIRSFKGKILFDEWIEECIPLDILLNRGTVFKRHSIDKERFVELFHFPENKWDPPPPRTPTKTTKRKSKKRKADTPEEEEGEGSVPEDSDAPIIHRPRGDSKRRQPIGDLLELSWSYKGVSQHNLYVDLFKETLESFVRGIRLHLTLPEDEFDPSEVSFQSPATLHWTMWDPDREIFG